MSDLWTCIVTDGISTETESARGPNKVKLDIHPFFSFPLQAFGWKFAGNRSSPRSLYNARGCSLGLFSENMSGYFRTMSFTTMTQYTIQIVSIDLAACKIYSTHWKIISRLTKCTVLCNSTFKLSGESITLYPIFLITYMMHAQ